MNDFTQIVKDALEYYDNNTMRYYDKIKTFKYYTILKDDGKIIFFDNGKNKIYESKYDVIGRFIPTQNIWVWGWSSGELNKDLILTSRKVLNYALDLDRQNILLKTALITSRYQISSPIQIDIHIALTSFLSKQPFVYRLDYFGEYSPDVNDTDNDSTKYNNVEFSEDEKKHIFKILNKTDPISSYYIVLLDK